jgi:mannitol-specific phosphotransferase system IIBC component
MAKKNDAPKPKGKGGDRHSPERLLAVFAQTRMGSYIVVAIAVHVVVVLATSYAYIRGWLDPEWARQREMAAKKAAAEEAKATEEMQAGKAIQEERKAAMLAAQKSNELAEAGAAKTNAAAELNRKIAEAFEKHGVDTNNPAVKEVLAEIPKERWLSEEILESIKVAKPDEVPAAPGAGLDISLEETN